MRSSPSRRAAPAVRFVVAASAVLPGTYDHSLTGAG
jgi:hypothetical protein